MHAREKSGAPYLGQATAALRWRPAVASRARGTVAEAPARGNGRWRSCGATRGCQREAGGGLGAAHGGERRWTAAGGAGQRRRREEQRICPEVEENGLFCNFQNFRD